MRNAFTILGLSARDARALNDLPHRQRLTSLTWLRRFYSILLHPDITGKSGDSLAEINAAFDSLQSTAGFSKAYAEFKPSSSESDQYRETLQAQAKYWKDKAEKVDPRMNRELERRAKIIEGLETKVADLSRELDQAHKQNENSWKLILKSRALQQDHQALRQRMRHLILNLMGQLARNSHNAPDGGTPLADLIGATFERARAVYFIDKNLRVLWKRHEGSAKYLSLGRLVGCLTPEDMEALGQKPCRISPYGKRYDMTIERLKFYFKRGMHLVTKRKTGHLHIYASIEDMVPEDEKEAAVIDSV
jgi:hypothetical protein